MFWAFGKRWERSGVETITVAVRHNHMLCCWRQSRIIGWDSQLTITTRFSAFVFSCTSSSLHFSMTIKHSDIVVHSIRVWLLNNRWRSRKYSRRRMRKAWKRWVEWVKCGIVTAHKLLCRHSACRRWNYLHRLGLQNQKYPKNNNWFRILSAASKYAKLHAIVQGTRKHAWKHFIAQ